MSEDAYAVTPEEARRLAVDKVRSAYGTFIRVGDGQLNEDDLVYEFPILTRKPNVIHSSDRESIIDVRFHKQLELGVVQVDARSREVQNPHREKIFRKIREHEESIENAIRKALVSVEGKSFAHLPFLENQFAPLEDLLSRLILEPTIPVEDIIERDEDRGGDRYQEYLNDLLENDLANRRGDELTQGDRLINLHDKNAEKYSVTLNDAMGIYFENNLDKFDLVYKTLGPYLVIAGRYYQRAIETREIPEIHEEELRAAIEAEYNGKRRRRSLFKFSHYLIKLQEVGILKPSTEGGPRLWKGRETVREDLEDMAEQFDPIQELLPAYA